MDSLTPQPSHHLNLDQTLRYDSAGSGKMTSKKAMERFQEFVMKFAETRTKSGLTPARKALLQDRLNQLVSEYKTPDHLPYSAMIERAIKELNEKEGSTEDAISVFISKEYDDLPLAHSTFLRHHLGKLCEYGHIVMTHDQRYMLLGDTYLKSNTKPKKKTRKRKSRWAWEKDSKRQHKKRNQMKKGYKVKSSGELMVFHKQKQLAENGMNSEEKQNKGMMAANELECFENLQSQKRDSDPPELMEGVSCAREEEKLEGEQAKDDLLEVMSPEIPPGFESIITCNLLHAEKVHSNKDSSPEEQIITIGGKELLGSPLSLEKFDFPDDPSDYELSKSNVLKDIQFSHDYGQMEQSEHQPASVDRPLLINEQHQPDIFNAESQVKMQLVLDNIVEICSKKAKMPSEPGSEQGGYFWEVEGHKSTFETSIACSGRFNNSEWLNYEDKLDIPIFEAVPFGLLPASADGFSQSRRMERQLRRWSFPVPKAANSIKSSTSSEEDHHLLQSKPSGVETSENQQEPPVSSQNCGRQMQLEKQLLKADALEVEHSVMAERKHKEIKKYFRRKKGSLPFKLPNENQFMPSSTTVVSPISPLTLQHPEFQLLNDKEPQGSLQQPEIPESGENFQDPPSPSIRSFHLTETDAVKDVILMNLMLPEPQPEECQQKMPKRRGRPPKSKPDHIGVFKNSNMTDLNKQSFKTPKRRSQRLLLTRKLDET